jgi:hypothetical protein
MFFVAILILLLFHCRNTKYLLAAILYYKGGPKLKVQVFAIYGLHVTSPCHLHVSVRQVEEK